MSIQYDQYISNHKSAVTQAYDWFVRNTNDVLPKENLLKTAYRRVIVDEHDLSKMSKEEYSAYDEYFYGDEKNEEINNRFQNAWLNHIHKNPHHWQHWVLINDDEGEVVLDMEHVYIVEMICDWWSFSWMKYRETLNPESLQDIFKWYDDHKDTMKLSDKTRDTVEDILGKMWMALN